MAAPITRLSISVADLPRARQLYETILGIPLKYDTPGMAMLTTSDGIELQLHERPPTPGDAGIAVSFGVDDVDAVTSAAVGASASIIKEPADQPWGERQSVLHHADGHVTLLWGRVNWIVLPDQFFCRSAREITSARKQRSERRSGC